VLRRRPSYVLYNSIHYVDPSGNLWFIAALIVAAVKAAVVGAVVGAAINASVAAIRGEDIGEAAWRGARAGAASGALLGAGGFAIGAQGFALAGTAKTLAEIGIAGASGAVGGGVDSHIQGGSFSDGLLPGTVGGILGYGASRAEILSNVVGESASLGSVTLHPDWFLDRLMGGFDSHAILEDDAVEHVRDLLVPAQPMPAFGGRLDELEDHRQRRHPGAAALRALGAQPDGGEGRFDDVRAAQRGPVLGGSGVEGEQLVAMRRQARHRLGVLLCEGADDALPRRLGLVPGRRLVDVVQQRLRLPLQAARQLLQDVGGLMHPAQLRARLRELFGQRHPEAQGAVARGHGRALRQAALLQLPQEAAPAVRRLAEAIRDGDEFLASVGGGADDHQQALPVGVQSDVEVDPIHPPVHVAAAREIAPVPRLVLPLPDLLEPDDGLGGEADHVPAQDRLERLGEVAGRDALEVQDGQQLLHVLGAAQVRGDQRAGEARFSMARQHAVIDPRGGDLHGACAGDDAADRAMAIADDLPMPLIVHQVLVPLQEQLDLDLDRALHQLASPLPDDLIQRHQRQRSVWTGPR